MKHLLCLAALSVTTAHAGFFTGNDLHTYMTSSSAAEQAIGAGYVMGVYDATHSVEHCPKPGVTARQARDVVAQTLRDNPTVRNAPADAIVMVSLARAWPCKPKPSM